MRLVREAANSVAELVGELEKKTRINRPDPITQEVADGRFTIAAV
jgi:hypothetical protein